MHFSSNVHYLPYLQGPSTQSVIFESATVTKLASSDFFFCSIAIFMVPPRSGLWTIHGYMLYYNSPFRGWTKILGNWQKVVRTIPIEKWEIMYINFDIYSYFYNIENKLDIFPIFPPINKHWGWSYNNTSFINDSILIKKQYFIL